MRHGIPRRYMTQLQSAMVSIQRESPGQVPIYYLVGQKTSSELSSYCFAALRCVACETRRGSPSVPIARHLPVFKASPAAPSKKISKKNRSFLAPEARLLRWLSCELSARLFARKPAASDSLFNVFPSQNLSLLQVYLLSQTTKTLCNNNASSNSHIPAN